MLHAHLPCSVIRAGGSLGNMRTSKRSYSQSEKVKVSEESHLSRVVMDKEQQWFKGKRNHSKLPVAFREG